MALPEKTNSGTFLLTGGTGFIGGNLLIRLVRGRSSVVLLKRSSSDLSRIRDVLNSIRIYDVDTTPLEKVFRENSIDTIIHCAAEQRKSATPLSFLETNVRYPLSLLDLARKHAVRCFINTDTILDRGVNAYALSKHHFRDWFRTFADELVCINVALELIYGPRDHESKFVTFVIRELLRGAETIDFTRGEQKRDFIYIDDVIDAFQKILDRRNTLTVGYHPYEVGTGRAVPVRDIAVMIKALTGNTRTKLNFGALPYRDRETMESSIDAFALRELGWEPRHSLERGLEATISAERERMQKSE